ncbi:MAG: phosphoribosylglycinamide formyltransferase [Proteobacteria bacterium]|nr:MAG: phosphoribosylglycinamide formyltransferase [Pseudomonadota bacterium]
MKVKVAIAVSGKGRSLENFLAGDYPFEVSAVITSNAKAGAVAIAQQHDLPLYIFDAKSPDPKGLEAWLKDHKIEWIALAGFLKIFPNLPAYASHVVNIHPALLPSYGGHGMYGMKVHEAIAAAKEAESGATIHFVNERYDEGAIIAQGKVNISSCVSADDIAHRVFELECKLYPVVLSRLVSGELPLPQPMIWQYQE